MDITKDRSGYKNGNLNINTVITRYTHGCTRFLPELTLVLHRANLGDDRVLTMVMKIV